MKRQLSVMGKNNKGFTLVELLIVVIILAVLAAIVIPQFSSSTKDAQESALDTTLAEMRNALELYYHQHGSSYPAAKPTTSGGADAGTQDAFLKQLTQYTDINGVVSTVRDATYKYGPYIKKQEIPKNPIDSVAAVTIVNAGADWGKITEPAAATGAGGWWFDTKSGKFVANITGYLTR